MNQAPPNKVVAWLPWCLHDAGTKTVWTIAKRWDLPISWGEIADACHECSICAQEALYPHSLTATDGQTGGERKTSFDLMSSGLCKASATNREGQLHFNSCKYSYRFAVCLAM